MLKINIEDDYQLLYIIDEKDYDEVYEKEHRDPRKKSTYHGRKFLSKAIAQQREKTYEKLEKKHFKKAHKSIQKEQKLARQLKRVRKR